MLTLGDIWIVGKSLESEMTTLIALQWGEKYSIPHSPFPIPYSPPSPETVLSKTDVGLSHRGKCCEIPARILAHPTSLCEGFTVQENNQSTEPVISIRSFGYAPCPAPPQNRRTRVCEGGALPELSTQSRASGTKGQS